MYCLVPAQYKVVQGGTLWYTMVQGGTNNGIWRYMEVQGRTRIVKIVQAGTYWHVLILMIQFGYAALRLDSLLQFCQADSAVLETTASNHTNASSSMFQSIESGPAATFGYLPCPYWRGASAAPIFRGAQQISPQGPAAVQGRQRQRRQGARRRWCWRRQRVRAWDHWYGSSLGD
jgi:hypothetical protein